jgi:hypothetical protein
MSRPQKSHSHFAPRARPPPLQNPHST